MDRRKFLRNGSLAGFGLSSLTIPAFGGPNTSAKPAPADPATASAPQQTGNDPASADFPLLEATIDQLQQMMQSGQQSSESITKLYLKRIGAIDKKGPALNAVIELNPDAPSIAAAMDAERKAGKIRGP
ncbi:MAG TPA: hypothetical protein VHE54_06400, partial [Puia sp.]|nr:hypothetical protein [Puia sp.]